MSYDIENVQIIKDQMDGLLIDTAKFEGLIAGQLSFVENFDDSIQPEVLRSCIKSLEEKYSELSSSITDVINNAYVNLNTACEVIKSYNESKSNDES